MHSIRVHVSNFHPRLGKPASIFMEHPVPFLTNEEKTGHLFFKKKTSQVAWEYWRFPFRGGAYGEAAHFLTYWVLIPEQRWQCKGIKFNESTSGNHCQLIKFIKFKLSSTPKLPIKYSTSFPCFNHCRFATWRRACLVGYQNMGLPVFFY